jgi:hypothetical protein
MLNAAIMSRRQWLVVLAATIALGAIAFRLQSKTIGKAETGALSGTSASIFVAPFSINENTGEHVSGAQLAEQVRTALGADKSVKISHRSGADYVLMGTVDRKQLGAEIGLRLVRARDASTAWSGTIWKSAADFPSSAGDLAAAVTEAIRAERDSEARRHEHQSSRTQRPR